MVERATVRIGTLRVLVTADHCRYLDAIETHLHSRRLPADDSWCDIELRIIDSPIEVETALTHDPMTVTGNAGRHVVSTRLMHAELDTTTSPMTASLRLHPEGQVDTHVLLYFVVGLNKLLQFLGKVRVHAAAVTVGTRTALFVGDKGAGKSTISLAMGMYGAEVLGDDQIVLELDGGRPMVVGSDDRIRLTAETEAHFFDQPIEGEPFNSGGVSKKQVDLASVVPAAPYVPRPVTDLFFPYVGSDLSIRPIGAGAALGQLLEPLLHRQRFDDNRDRMAFIDLVANAIPERCHKLELSPDLECLRDLYDYLSSPA